MSIDIEVKTKRGSKRDKSAACWVQLNELLREMRGLGSPPDLWHKEKPDNPYPDLPHGGHFEVILHLGEDTEYFNDQSYSTSQRNLSDRIFDELFGPMLRDDWVSYRQDNRPKRKARTAIVYSDLCPYWLMIASGSIYRMHCDMSQFIYYWERIVNLEKILGYKTHPWTKYFLITNLSNMKNSNADWSKSSISLGSNTNHMPINSSSADIHHIRHISQLTHKMLTKGNKVGLVPLKSIHSEYWSDNPLKVRGRDSYFLGGGIMDENWIIIKGKEHKLIKTKTDNYTSVSTVDLPKFYEKVIIPNNM